ncbi:peroxiredoxin family protein [Haladaptatus sp. GCM10025707]|uniref:peroxiredoxin family protein n=1 Tax=unclassified Haladaptatus TaxID=2622732 RepID=UPI0023E8CF66|nr:MULTISPECIES: redoxin domain-containing protein [unclassified Haladaptatus]
MTLEGTDAPEFSVEGTDGSTRTLTAAREDGPVVVLTFRGHWCSYCAEQLQTFSNHAYDLWRNHDTTIIAVSNEPVSRLREMRDRFDLKIQLFSDLDLELVSAYAGTEHHAAHGEIPLAGTFIVDEEGVVQYEQVATNPADRTYANYVRHVINNGYERPYAE